MEIFLIRHTKVDVPDGTCYGFSDVGLASTFPEELNSLISRLPDRNDFVLYSSPLKRCRRLAEELGIDSGIEFDDRLKELNFGNWELKKWDEISRKEFLRWSKDFVNQVPPNGESYIQLFRRCNEFYEEILHKKENKIAIVAHGGVIRSLLSHVLSIPLEKSFHLQIDYGSISKIKIASRKIKVEYINR